MKSNYVKNNFHNKEVGKLGEDDACKYLESLNYKILSRNFLTKYGEIDIIAKDKNEYVFIEVKSRLTNKYGNPAEAVTLKKENHIIKASKWYMYFNKLENQNIRYDVIEVYLNSENRLINHFRNVFF